MLLKSIFLLILLGCIPIIVMAQDAGLIKSSTVYSSLKARKYKIVLGTRRVIVAHTLDSLSDGYLYTTRNKESQKISLAIIKELQVAKKKRPVSRGLGLGALAGVGFGALTGLLTYQEPEPNGYFTIDLGPGVSAAAGAVAGAVLGVVSGTVIGATSNRFTHYDFTKIIIAERPALMTRILQGN